MRKPYVLARGITKKSLQLNEEVKICIFVSVYYYCYLYYTTISFNTLRIHEVKTNMADEATRISPN